MRALAVTMILITSPVWAVEIPKVDVDRSCRVALQAVGDTEKRSPEVQFQQCFEAAQASYDRLRTIWPQLSDSNQSFCLSTTASAMLHHHHAYRDLAWCSRTTLQRSEAETAHKEIPAGEFRY